jgi:hypothetical protein
MWPSLRDAVEMYASFDSAARARSEPLRTQNRWLT